MRGKDVARGVIAPHLEGGSCAAVRGVGPGGACARRGRPEGPPPPVQRRSLVLPPVEAADGGVVDGRFLLGRESTVGWFLSLLFALSLLPGLCRSPLGRLSLPATCVVSSFVVLFRFFLVNVRHACRWCAVLGALSFRTRVF